MSHSAEGTPVSFTPGHVRGPSRGLLATRHRLGDSRRHVLEAAPDADESEGSEDSNEGDGGSGARGGGGGSGGSRRGAGDQVTFEVTGLSTQLRVVRYEGEESISELFAFTLTVASEDSAIDLTSVVGKPCLFTFQGANDPRYVHGLVARFEDAEIGKKLTTYHVTVVPTVWSLRLRSDCRIFQQLTTPDIIKKVLDGAGFTSGDHYRFQLRGSYSPRDYCVQYRESDFDFISRLMEEEGIFYSFEHSDTKDVIVFGDQPSAHSPIPSPDTIKFRPPTGAIRSGESIFEFRVSEEMRTGKITLRDYSYLKPALQLESSKSGPQDSDLEVYDHPGDYEVPGAGAALAAIRLEEHQVERARGKGASGVARITSGGLFTLAEHPREAHNREWLITHVRHEGAQDFMGESAGGSDDRYENRFRVMPSGVPFRPRVKTPRPTIKGVQSAFVVGPSGEEIYTDELGRVKVQFHWDRLGKNDDKSSCWIRVSQVWAGEGWGAMHIPRVGQEVLVDFLDGDPDRPIIVGRVYHGTNVPPAALPANKTQSTIKSNSTPGGGGSNELRFEDKKNAEEVYLHAQKDLTILVENDRVRTVHHDESIRIDNDRAKDVGNDQSMKVGRDEKETIGRDRSEDVARDHTESIGRNMSLSVSKDLSVDVGGKSTESVGDDRQSSFAKNFDTEVTGSMSTKVGGARSEEVGTDLTVKVASKIVIECGSSKVTVDKEGNITIEGKKLDVKFDGPAKVAGADIDVEATGKVTVKSSGPTKIEASGPLAIKGAMVGIN